MLASLTVFMVGTAVAADYYVFANQHGQKLVLDYAPSAGWTRIDGPYATMDAAKRACGIGSVPASGSRRAPTAGRAAF